MKCLIWRKPKFEAMTQLNEWMNQWEKQIWFSLVAILGHLRSLECQQICKMFSRANSLLIRIVDLDDFILVGLTIRGWRPCHPATSALKVQYHHCLSFRWSYCRKPYLLQGLQFLSDESAVLSTTLLSRSGLAVCIGTGCWLSRRSVTWRHNLELEEDSMMFLYKPSYKDETFESSDLTDGPEDATLLPPLSRESCVGQVPAWSVEPRLYVMTCLYWHSW